MLFSIAGLSACEPIKTYTTSSLNIDFTVTISVEKETLSHLRIFTVNVKLKNNSGREVKLSSILYGNLLRVVDGKIYCPLHWGLATEQAWRIFEKDGYWLQTFKFGLLLEEIARSPYQLNFEIIGFTTWKGVTFEKIENYIVEFYSNTVILAYYI